MVVREVRLPRRGVLGRFGRHRAAAVGLVVLVLVAAVAVTSIGFGPLPGWWRHGYTVADPVVDGGRPTLRLLPFSLGDHPFGQDTIGKDYFALVMRGTQRSLIIAAGVGLVATGIGTVVGAVAGYARGWVDAVLMRVTDLLIVVPLLVLAAVLARRAGGIGQLTLLLGAVTWTGLARLVRAEVLSLRERDFVVAARAAGAGPVRIVATHLLPHSAGVIIVSATFAVASAILLETSLSYLGFGVHAPDTSLGLLISTYQQAVSTRPWLFWWPGGLILVIALSVNVVGDGLRDAYDPRASRGGP